MCMEQHSLRAADMPYRLKPANRRRHCNTLELCPLSSVLARQLAEVTPRTCNSANQDPTVMQDQAQESNALLGDKSAGYENIPEMKLYRALEVRQQVLQHDVAANNKV